MSEANKQMVNFLVLLTRADCFLQAEGGLHACPKISRLFSTFQHYRFGSVTESPHLFLAYAILALFQRLITLND